MNKLLLVALFFIGCITANAQLAVDYTQNPEWYVQNVLVGEGVEISNVTFNGNPGADPTDQVGEFTATNSLIPYEQGLVMASGNVDGVIGPNNQGGAGIAPNAGGVSGDPDLEALIPGFDVNDVAILEFDFVPCGDTITFNYIFGSDEYLEYVNSSFNDVFGFFVCGPGITGPFSTPDDVIYPDGSANIAIVPGTDLPVTIDNVNDQVNSEFYIINGDGFTEPFSSDPFYPQYDGITVSLPATAVVVPGETYHIKLAVADAGDSAFDSGIFLQGGSFGSNVSQAGFDYFGDATSLVESSPTCDEGFLVIERSPCEADSAFLAFEYGGDATLNDDYNPLPDDVFLNEGETQVTVPVNVLADGIEEGFETIEIYILSSSTGEDGTFIPFDTVEVVISDSYTFPIDEEDFEVFCPTDSTWIEADVSDTIAVLPFAYEWFYQGDFYGDTNPIEVPVPAQYDSTYYNLTIIDACGMPSIPDSVWVYNKIADDPEALVGMNGQYCVGVPYDLSADLQPFTGTSPLSYAWSNGDDTYISSVAPLIETTFSVTITDGCGRESTAEGTVILPDPMEGNFDVQDYICEGEILDLTNTATAQGGIGSYTYQYFATPTVGVVDYDPISGAGTIGPIFSVDPEDDFSVIQVNMKDYCQRLRDSLDINIYSEILTMTDTLNLVNCIVPNVITPNGDDVNQYFQAEEMLVKPATMFVYDRWGKLLEETSNYRWDAGNNSDGTYFYVIAFEDGDIKKGTFTILTGDD